MVQLATQQQEARAAALSARATADPLSLLPIERREVYNPIRLFALVAEKGWSWRDYQECHFPAFFAMLREWGLLAEERDRESDRRVAAMRNEGGSGAALGIGPGIGSTLEAEMAQAAAGAQKPLGMP